MKTPLKILIVEDSKDDAELLLHALRHAGYDPAFALVRDAAGLRARLASGPWDLVISDYILPGFGGLAALEALRESGHDIPFIIVSGKIGEDVAIEALHAGANDYLLKDRLTRLGPAIGRALKEASQRRKRLQAEEALRESEERYRRLVESCPEAMFIASGGKIVFANPAALSLIAAPSPIELIGKPLLEFIDPPCRVLFEEHLRRSLEGLDGPLLEHKLLKPDGSAVLVESMARRIPYHDDDAVQLLCRDVSSRKQLEQQLLNAQKMEAIARLAGGVANDFNNLLTVITGYSGLMRSALPAAHPLQYDLRQVIQSTERAIGLTGQLLAISRKDIPAPEPISLNAVIEQAAPLLRRLLGESVELAFSLDSALRLIRADRGQLETLVLNLAVHSRESMIQGGRLTLQTSGTRLDPGAADHRQLPAGDYVVLTLVDTGPGLTEEYQQHLFEPFFGTSQPGKNTGLGLATVYAIVRQHGGHISCSSQLGQGSTFTICFPACAPVSILPHPPAPAAPSPRGGLIVLAEDEEVLGEFAAFILEKEGFQVLRARDGLEALRLAAQSPSAPDLLFTDIVMPRLNGAELCRRFRERFSGTPILCTSGYPRTILSESGIADPAIQFIQKPYTQDALIQKVRAILASNLAPTAVPA